MRYAEVLETADRHAVYKQAAKETAMQEGLVGSLEGKVARHRAGDCALDTGTCRRANSCAGNRTRALTNAGKE